MPREHIYETREEAASAARALNEAARRKRLGSPRRKVWAVADYGGLIPAPEEDDYPDRESWFVVPGRSYQGGKYNRPYVVLPGVVRAERLEKVALWIALAFGFLGTFTLLGSVAMDLFEGSDYDPPPFAVGAIAGLVCGLSIWWAYYLNQRAELPLDEKYGERALPEQEWRDRTEWIYRNADQGDGTPVP